MRIISVVTATVIAGALVAGGLVPTASADAATVRHLAAARADWKHGAHVAAAEQNKYWGAARTQLAAGGAQYSHERAVLGDLTAIPLTDTTARQRLLAARETRELNGFFGTPNLYGVPQGNPKTYARKYWIKSSKVSAAEQNAWFGAAKDELAAYGSRYKSERAHLTSLESIPLTDTTAKQRAAAHRDVRALNTFFHTPGVNA